MSRVSGLAFRLTVDGQAADAWQLLSLSGCERLSQPTRWEWLIAGPRAVSDISDWLGKSVWLEMHHQGRIQRQLGGEIRALQRLAEGRHLARLRLEVVDPLARLALRDNCRIFQQQDARQIVRILLDEHHLPAARFVLSGVLRPREYCVQYHETDLAFLQRLLSEEGCVFYYDWTHPRRPLVITNSLSVLQDAGILAFNSHPAAWQDPASVTGLTQHWLQPTELTRLRHYHYLQPTAPVQAERGVCDSTRLHFIYPGLAEDPQHAEQRCAIYHQSRQVMTNQLQGVSGLASMRLGLSYTVQGHCDGERAWQPLSIEHTAQQAAALEAEPHEGMTSYHNRFTFVPADQLALSAPLTRPVIAGPQSARVVGPPGEEIYCDDQGRIKVQFYWDQHGHYDDHSSCWLRVVQPLAGAGFGSLTLPRVGQEVLVQFLDGDADRPVITGCLYDGAHPLPYPLPENKSRTVMRSHSLRSDGYNELSFDDATGQEQIRLKAERDLQLAVGRRRLSQIAEDDSLHVAGNSRSAVAGDSHLRVDGNSHLHTGGAWHQRVDQQLVLQCGREVTVNGGGDLQLQAAGEICLEAGKSLVLKVGRSFLRISHDGITLVAPVIRLNSGGQERAHAAVLPSPPLSPDGIQMPEIPPLAPWQPDIRQQIDSVLAVSPYLFSC